MPRTIAPGRLLALAFVTSAAGVCADAPAPAPAYRNPALTVQERVADLLGRMTLEEKVGQLMLWDARGEDLSFINTRQPGSILHVLGAKIGRAMDLAARNRLAIPLLVGEDGIHGHSFWKGATIFPTQLALAASWNPELLEQVGRVTAEEMTPTGIHWTFSPVLCLSRDLRWGRTGETFGEDPYLIGELGAALIRGYQGKGLDDPAAVLATAKHYAGYSETQGGRDSSEADLSRRKLRSYFLPPFERAARAGAMTFMTGYQSIEGVPSTANRWLLVDVLKNEWGFRGVVVTDWDNVGRLVYEQKVCATYAEGHYNLCYTDLKMGRCREAVQDCTQAISVKPEYIEAKQNLTQAYECVAKQDGAVKEYIETIKNNPGDAEPHFILGTLYEDRNLYDEALNEFLNTIKLNSKHALAHYRAARVYDKMMRTEDTVNMCQRFVDLLRDAKYDQERAWCVSRVQELQFK